MLGWLLGIERWLVRRLLGLGTSSPSPRFVGRLLGFERWLLGWFERRLLG